MQQTQTVIVNVLESIAPPNTGFGPMSSSDAASGAASAAASPVAIVAVALVLVLFTAALVFVFKKGSGAAVKAKRRATARKCVWLASFLIVVLLLGFAHGASAASSLQITSSTLNITVNKSAAAPVTQTAVSTTTVITNNPTGYTLSAKLAVASTDGIVVELNAEVLSTASADIHADDTGASPSSYDHILAVTVPASVPVGTYSFDVVYAITENAPTAPQTMQTFTKAYCTNNMVLNETITLTDTRNSQDYEIRKLADGNCWMIDNLKIGSTAGTMTLTSDDTDLNVASNPRITDSGGTLSFALPQISPTGAFDYDNPYAWGEVTGDTGVGDTNYGYLYNWPAATAGESQTTMPGDGTNNDIAPNSICPKNWRMPTGGQLGDTNNELDQLNAKMAGFVNNQDPAYLSSHYSYYTNWQYTGAFRGVFSGAFGYAFDGQGVSGLSWSSSAYFGQTFAAHAVNFTAGTLQTYNGSGRNYGFAVRCIVN